MNRKGWTVLALGVTLGLGLVAMTATAAPKDSTDEVKIAAFLQEMKTMTPATLNELKPLTVRRFELPGSGIDVMRARLQETYSVDGVGTDTVELSGWIAVKHDNARPVKGAMELNWNTAVVDTEFVAMDLSGVSEVFGPVHVGLDRTLPSYGQVGRVEIPELARAALLARLDTSARDQMAATTEAAPARGEEADAAAVCSAPVYASVTMPDLGLKMKTKNQVFWYSLVDTIPPVGHTASVAVEPVRLIADGREVGTLESGLVTFREVVRHVALTDNNERLANNK